QPAHGAVAITGGGTGLTYQPAADYYGEDSFTYTITDEDGLTATATVTVTVTPQPDAPSVADDSLVVPADAPATAVDVLANDTTQPDGVQAMTVTAVTQGAHGLVEIEAGGARVTYQPQTGWFGDDSFTYTVTDEDGLTATASVAVTVLPPVGPDLAVALLDKALPEAIVSGERLVGRVRVVISNSGNEPVPAGRRADVEVWAVSGPTEILVGALPNLAIGGLGVGAVKAAAIAVFQPDSLPSGQYRLEVRIAPTEPMAELSVANNEALVQNELISAEPFIDLEPAIDSVAVAAPATGGDRLAVRLRVTNRGNVPVSQRGDIELWAVDGPSETLLVRLPRQLLSMGAGQVRVFAAVATVPATLPAGTYDLQVRIDTAGEVDESDEANNTAVSPAALNVQNPDLAVGFARSTLPATVVPGDRGVVFAEIGNLAAVRASGAVDLQLWASPDGVVGDDDDVLLASLANQRIVLPAGGSRLYPLRATVPGTMAPGEYQLVLVVDAADAVTEADETNNQALAADPLAMKLRFGTFDGRRNVALRLTDSAGVQSTFTVRGNGYGEVAGGDFDTVELFETDLSSAVRVVSRGAAGLGDVTVHGSLGSFTAPGIALRGDVGVSGTIRSLALGDLAGGNTVAIGPAEAGSNVAAVLSFAQVSDAALTSQTPIRTLTAAAWLDSGGAHETVTAPQINLLRIAGDRRRGLSGDFEADLVLDGGQPVSLAAVQIDGWLRNSTVRTDGSIGVFQAGGFDHANVLAGLRDDLIGLPQDAADFDALAQAQIRVLTARGIRGDTGPAFIDSNVAAWTIGKAVLQRVDTAGDEGPFGLAARGYASVLWTDLAGRRTLVRQSQAAQVEDFLIRVI
ncbi:MAG: cadherin-like domain-containing protein, partial [Planctomycetes bacterium]|nr:cadherin-like domain-containing protein [Planctomycetota bacterium]